MDRASNCVVAGPDIVSRGFVYVRDAGDLMDDAQAVLNTTMDHLMDRGVTGWGRIKQDIKDALGSFVWKETKRRPMIIPIIMEV